MNKLFTVKRSIEDYPNKWDIDFILVTAETWQEAEGKVKSKREDGQVHYETREVLSDNGVPVEVKGTIKGKWIASTVKDNNRDGE